MTKNEFLTQFSKELSKRNIADAADIAVEYEQHFAFKLADGYTEEEISAKLGNPAELAAQFENAPKAEQSGGRKCTTVIGLIFANLFAAPLSVLLWVWAIVMGAAAIGFAGLAGCLLLGYDLHALIPAMPYGCAVLFGLSCLALAFLTAVGCIWFVAYLRQLMRVCRRFNRNTMASASGKPVLPPLPMNPQLAAKTKRRLRHLAQVSLIVFAVCFVLGMIVSMLSAHAFQFWHVWGWFGYTGRS